MKPKSFVIGSLVAGLIAGPAMAASGESCLYTSQVKSWSVPVSKQVVLKDTEGDDWLVKLRGAQCNNIKLSDQIAVYSWLPARCVNGGDHIMFFNGGKLGATCLVDTVNLEVGGHSAVGAN